MRVDSLSSTSAAPDDPRALSDDDLLRRLADLLRQSRRVESELIAHIAEVDRRRLYAREAADSMFAYCTDVMHLSEHEAYLRITVARAAREHPVLMEMLADGRLHVSGIAKLVPHLTHGNRDALLARAIHKTKKEVCELIAELAPKPDAPQLMRRLPETKSTTPLGSIQGGPGGGGTEVDSSPSAELGPDLVLATGSARPARVEPLSPARYLIQFTASAEFHGKLRRLTALMRTTVPDGDLAAILERAVTEKLQRLEARRFGQTKRPRKTLAQCDTDASPSRYIPAPVRRSVDDRDDRRCRFVDARGRRCRAETALQFHHVHGHARGGDRSVGNIQLMCRTHNISIGERDYGKATMARYRRDAAGGRTVDPAAMELAGPPADVNSS